MAKRRKKAKQGLVRPWMYAALLAGLGLAGGSAVVAYVFFAPNVPRLEKDFYLYLRPGDGFEVALARLVENKALDNVTTFVWAADWVGLKENIRPGRYRVRSGMSNFRLTRNLLKGYQTPVRITLPTEPTLERIVARLGAQLAIGADELRAAVVDSLNAMGIPSEFHVAFFFPDTYEFYWTATAGDIVQFFKKRQAEFWTQERLEKAKSSGLTKEQVVVLASIVEAETSQNAEKPTIAGVYINRLRRGEKLRADPTVIFALGNPKIHRVLHKHLKVDSPYNTYKYRGLPPGPINAPGQASIDATLNYDKHDYLFFCAKGDFSGFHNFARTYEEHKAYAREYQSALDSLMDSQDEP
jgi:UPF0755 protein